MGGHGGLNILPQKSWNVYNFENREKVRRDEEAAAKEEQLKHEQSRRRDAEFRLEKLRQANKAKRKNPPEFESPEPKPHSIREAVRTDTTDDVLPDKEDNHINLFKGWDVFQVEGEVKERKRKDEARPVEKRRRKDEENAKVVLPEDEKYRMGYGVAGKDVKKPWYLSTSFMAEEEIRPPPKRSPERNGEITRKKKSLQELREERLKREQQERERARKLFFSGSDESKGKPDVSFHNRAPFYNSAYQNRR